ncbi:MAG: M12 family metallo-peptidase [Kiritimatiellia bacterium]
MKELLEKILMYSCFAGLGGIAIVAFVRVMLMSWRGDSDSPGEWSIDGGWNWLCYPSPDYPGYCNWMPTLRGSPDVSHLGPDDFPATFEAVLSDIPQSCAVEYEWTADAECFDIVSPRSKSTQITAKSMPRWNETTLSVSARFKDKSLTSMTTPFTYGTNATPSVSIALDYPSVTFLNDDNRSDRIYRLSAVIQGDSATNGTFTIVHSGDDNPLIAVSTNFSNTSRSFSYRFSLDRNCLCITNNFYVMSRNVRHGTFSFSCTLADGATLTSRRDYNVIEPLCKLITTQKGPDGRYLNPSRLVYGTNTWLQVGVNGDFPSSQIRWFITPDTCRCLQSCDYKIKIEPTVTSGVAVVKARFNDDLHQPTFTLPIVMPRTIPIKAFIVNDGDGNMVTTVDRVRRQISTANEIFDQVGIKFDLQSTGRVMSTNFHTLAEYDIASDGSTNTTVSAQAISLFNAYTNRNCIEIYYVSKITNSKAVGFCCTKGIVISSGGSDYSLAHELGHALGAKDCYPKTEASRSVTQWFARILPRRNYFGSVALDWGDAEGRGFYEKSDMYYTILSKCLMNGFDGYCQADIPDSAALSLKKNARSNSDLERSSIGATVFEGKRNEEVYSR